MKNIVSGAALSLGLLANPLWAATEATATTDLNIRSGPGPFHEVVGVIDGDATATVEGCLEDANWCQVSYNGVSGWSSGDYLNATVNEAPMALSLPETRKVIELQTVTFDSEGKSVAGGVGAGAIVGALIAGPVGAAVGAVLGAGAGAAVAPDPEVVTYVRSNPVDPVYLDGEVVVGASVPQEVELLSIPGSDYQYLYVNGVPVVVEPAERRIVTIVR